MTQSKYLPKQMNGSIVNAYMQALEDRLENAKTICDYLHGLSIATAQETELENIGKIIGYPRPLVPIGFEQENVFLFTESCIVDNSIGFSATDSEVGGRFVSTTSSSANYMNLGLYRSVLDKIAYIKRYGVTLYSVDKIASLISKNYTIYYDENKDIVIHFSEYIGYQNLWLLSNLFYKFVSLPQVHIVTDSE